MKIKISTGIFLTVLTANVIFFLSLCFRDNYTDYSCDHVQDFTLMRFWIVLFIEISKLHRDKGTKPSFSRASYIKVNMNNYCKLV